MWEKTKTAAPKGIGRTVSPLILPTAVCVSAFAMWWINRTHEIASTHGWPGFTIVAGVLSAYALRRRWRRALQAAYHEGYADGYLRGASDRIAGITPAEADQPS
ncbi:hypothetical protein AB0M02_00545 [Actinoplanes sp. NPDC051861]|uniref:hypothetical protein n=1 Tax=Actinoplanes sp. NPDC051861 TaxID=3155170 RepID=UPI00342DAF0C